MVHRRRRPQCGDIVLISSPSHVYLFTNNNNHEDINEHNVNNRVNNTYNNNNDVYNNKYENVGKLCKNKKHEQRSNNHNKIRVNIVRGNIEDQEITLFIGNNSIFIYIYFIKQMTFLYRDIYYLYSESDKVLILYQFKIEEYFE